MVIATGLAEVTGAGFRDIGAGATTISIGFTDIIVRVDSKDWSKIIFASVIWN